MRPPTPARPLAPHRRPGVVRFRGLAALLASLALAACSATATPAPTAAPSQAGPAPTAGVAASAAPTAAPSVAFPLTLKDDEGNTVTLTAQPRAIVSLTPAATEAVFAMGAGDRLVGKVEDFSVYPPEAAKVPDVAKFGSVDVERIVALKADLVIAGGNSFNPPAELARLRGLGIPVLTIYGPNLATALADITLVGKAIGRPAEAAAVLAAIEASFDRVKAAVNGHPAPRVYYELDATNGFFGPAPDYFGVEMIEIAGGKALTSGTPGAFQIPEEKIIAFDPEVILLGDFAYGVTVEQVAARPGWAGLTAVRQQAVRPVDDVVITRPGPRLGQGLEALARAIHPDSGLASPTASKAP